MGDSRLLHKKYKNILTNVFIYFFLVNYLECITWNCNLRIRVKSMTDLKTSDRDVENIMVFLSLLQKC